ncbi:MAG: TlpA disulfide reductase family protein [Ignavibacteriaceae bacterium]|nr:TlpA disulfide reductase family protein [Ignavibacteriaceae bacterium]
MKYPFIYIFVIFSLTGISAQTIDIKIHNLNQGKAQLSYLRSGNVVFIDSLFSTNNDFHYSFAKNAGHPGLYRLYIAGNRWIDFIIDNEDVILSTDADNIVDSMDVIRSESNKFYYDYINLNKQYKIKTTQLLATLDKYQKDDKNSVSASNDLNQLKEQYFNFINITSQKNAKSFVARYIRSVQLPAVDVNLSVKDQVAYQKLHYLDNINFNDDDLLYSDAFNIKSLKFITLFRNPGLPKDLLVKEFISAADTLLNKAKVNQLVYQYITGCLIDKFGELGYNEVINYIVEYYVIKDDLCLDEKLPNSIQQRIDQSKSFRVGMEVPRITLTDPAGNEIDLKDINSENTLILFYASWCPHCQKLLPKVNNLYLKQKEMKIKIFAVSLDTSRSDWLNFIRKNNYNWINVSDLKGGYGKAVRDYKIYATPAMFLVNGKKELIVIPSDIEDLKKYFN